MSPVFFSAVEILLAMQAGLATVTGSVHDSDTGEPLAGAEVAFVELRRSTSTDGDGRYALRSVPPGAQQITVRFVGHAPRSVLAIVPPDGDPRARRFLDSRAGPSAGPRGSIPRNRSALHPAAQWDSPTAPSRSPTFEMILCSPSRTRFKPSKEARSSSSPNPRMECTSEAVPRIRPSMSWTAFPSSTRIMRAECSARGIPTRSLPSSSLRVPRPRRRSVRFRERSRASRASPALGFARREA